MSKGDFWKLLQYQITMSIAKKMLNEGLLQGDEYDVFEQNMLEKYQPLYGRIFSERR